MEVGVGEFAIEEILTGLTFPVGNMAFGPDGALYLSNYSAFSGRTGKKGEILRVEVPSDEDQTRVQSAPPAAWVPCPISGEITSVPV